MTEGSRDYHDYFIKDGRFIGRFEEMYQNVDDPWHIEALGRRLDMDAALLLLQSEGRTFSRILDVGCGKGFFTRLILEETGGSILALDVSETAAALARQEVNDERIEFRAFDLGEIEKLARPEGGYDLVVMAQTVWCVLPRLSGILNGFRRLLNEDGRLLISQHFLQPGQQKYGREIISGPEDLIRMVEEAGFKVLNTLETNRRVNHHLALTAAPGEA